MERCRACCFTLLVFLGQFIDDNPDLTGQYTVTCPLNIAQTCQIWLMCVNCAKISTVYSRRALAYTMVYGPHGPTVK